MNNLKCFHSNKQISMVQNVVVVINYFNVYEIYKGIIILVTTSNIIGFVLGLIKNIISINPIQIVLFKKFTFR